MLQIYDQMNRDPACRTFAASVREQYLYLATDGSRFRMGDSLKGFLDTAQTNRQPATAPVRWLRFRIYASTK